MAKKEQPQQSQENPSDTEPRQVGVEAIPPGPGSKEINKDARQWAMFCHLAGLAYLMWWILPLVGGVVATLIIWQIKKGDYPFVDEQGKEAVNFQISMLTYGVVAGLLCFACVGFVLLPAVIVVDLVFLLIAAVKANGGEHYRYPVTIRFIK